jgi:hypothetical protein
VVCDDWLFLNHNNIGDVLTSVCPLRASHQWKKERGDLQQRIISDEGKTTTSRHAAASRTTASALQISCYIVSHRRWRHETRIRYTILGHIVLAKFVRTSREISVSWIISPLKSSHFQNCSALLARFLVCSQVTADAFGNHLGKKCVTSMKKVFSFHWIIVFVQFFSNLSMLFWLHMRVCSSISIRRNRIRALLSLPRLALRAEKFQESSQCTWCAVNVGLWNGMAVYVTNTWPLSTRPRL